MRYIKWVETAEQALATHTVSDNEVDQLHTARYWKIRELTETTARPWPHIQGEVEHQRRRLTLVAERLGVRPLARALADPDEVVVILDTNIHLHFEPFDQVDWPAVTGHSRVLLAVPLLVIEELDKHKNRGGVLGDRAEAVSRRLLQLLEPAGSGVVDVRTGVHVSLLRDIDGQRRTGNNDEDILDRVQAHLDVGGRPVVIVTSDGGMRLRSGARGITAVEMPKTYRRESVDPTERRIRSLKRSWHENEPRRPHRG